MHCSTSIKRQGVHTFATLLLTLLAACAGSTSQIVAPQPEARAPVVELPARIAAPVASKRPYSVVSPNGDRNDDYYWLRDDKREAVDVLDYLKAENSYRDALLAPTEALQTSLFEEMVARLPPDDATVPQLEHGWWVYKRYEAGKEYPIYARRKGSMTAPEQVMLDGNALANGASYYQIGDAEISPDGRLVAYAEDTIGRRQYTLKVKNLDTGALLADTVVNVEPNLIWANDNKTLLYIEKDPVTLLSVRAHKHLLGSDAARDPLIYEEKDHSYYMTLNKAKSEKYLFIELQSTLQSEWRFADAGDPGLKFKTVLPRKAGHEYQVDHLGRDFVLRSNLDAPNFRIVRAPIATRDNPKTWIEVVPNRPDAFPEAFEVFDKNIVIHERSGGLSKLRVKSWDGKRDYLIDSTEPAYTTELDPTPDPASGQLRYVYTSLTTPRSTYNFDLASGKKTLLKQEAVLGGFDPQNYKTEYLHATARDGTSVPVSVAYRRGTQLDGSAPLYQYGYGSYGSSSDPIFRPTWLSLMDRGFVVAIAHIRGGQELGRAWYEDGKLLKKKNTFTDFVDVTEYLVKNKYGAKDKVFAEGRSAGGLLMGAVANIAPQDYRGIVAGVPFVDVMTTMLDESIPLTTNEFDEWGNPKEKASYDYMLSYSPYDNVTAQKYPAIYVATGLWDSQVQYYEPAKWVAKLRALKTDDNPLILSIDMAAGHGGKPGRYEKYHETAREYAFMLNLIGITQ